MPITHEISQGCGCACRTILEYCFSANGKNKEQKLSEHTRACKECANFVQELGIFINTRNPQLVDQKIVGTVQKVAGIIMEMFNA